MWNSRKAMLVWVPRVLAFGYLWLYEGIKKYAKGEEDWLEDVVNRFSKKTKIPKKEAKIFLENWRYIHKKLIQILKEHKIGIPESEVRKLANELGVSYKSMVNYLLHVVILYKEGGFFKPAYGSLIYDPRITPEFF